MLKSERGGNWHEQEGDKPNETGRMYVWKIKRKSFNIITNLLIPAPESQQKRKGKMEC